jgi:hypothetical protein
MASLRERVRVSLEMGNFLDAFVVVGCIDVVAVALFPVFAVGSMSPHNEALGGKPSLSESSAPAYGVISPALSSLSLSLLDLEEEEERERPFVFSPPAAGA